MEKTTHSMSLTLGALYAHPSQLQRVLLLIFPVEEDGMEGGSGWMLTVIVSKLVGGKLDGVGIPRGIWKGSGLVELLDTTCLAFSP